MSAEGAIARAGQTRCRARARCWRCRRPLEPRFRKTGVRLPTWTVVVPVQAFVPLRLMVPAPSLGRPPAPWIALLMGRVVPDPPGTCIGAVGGQNVLGAVFPPVLLLHLPLPSHFRGSRCCRSQGCGGASRRCSGGFLDGHGTGEGVGGIDRARAGIGAGGRAAALIGRWRQRCRPGSVAARGAFRRGL